MGDTLNSVIIAGIAQLGEQQTEVHCILEVPCSIHGPGISFSYVRYHAQ